MNKIQKRIHQLTRISVGWCEDTEYQFISYRQHRKACKEDLTKRFTKSQIIQNPIEELFS